MKRIIRTFFLLLLAVTIPFTMASGQDKKEEKKIKIIVDEGTGSKTILDTIIIGTDGPEKIELKDGTIVFIGSPEMDLSQKSDGKKVIVSVETDSNGEKQIEKSVYVTSADSPTWTVSSAGEKGYVYVISSDKSTGGKGEKHIMISSTGDNAAEWVSEDSDATKYVVAKDGVIVTVESDDEEKAQEIIKLIQDKLGVKSEEKK
ncbi:MAG: hypothetical protein V1903_02595 [Bacteroidota bacterium]